MFGARKERDPNLIKLEQDVFGKMHQEIQKEQPVLPETQSNGVDFVSFEQALRELSDISQSTDDKS